MTKKDAIQLFGSVGKMAAAIGVRSQTVSGYPDELPQSVMDRVIAATCMMEIDLPEHIQEEWKELRGL